MSGLVSRAAKGFIDMHNYETERVVEPCAGRTPLWVPLYGFRWSHSGDTEPPPFGGTGQAALYGQVRLIAWSWQ